MSKNLVNQDSFPMGDQSRELYDAFQIVCEQVRSDDYMVEDISSPMILILNPVVKVFRPLEDWSGDLIHSIFIGRHYVTIQDGYSLVSAKIVTTRNIIGTPNSFYVGSIWSFQGY